MIFISLNELPRKCRSYGQYIERIENGLIKDLKDAYPKAGIQEDDAVWDAFSAVYHSYDSKRFIFILDEWDFIFHRDFVTQKDREEYIDFLSNLLKGKAYVSLAYMTGILPIAKYSSGSELNMFLEYTMVSEELYGEYFGFTEAEVDELYERFLLNQKNPRVTREGLRLWYDGYHIRQGERVYNPRSVVAALTNNNLGNYWTSSGPYDEIFYYIEQNTAQVREDLVKMISDIPVEANVCEYAASSFAHNTEVPLLNYSNETDLTAVVNLIYLAARDTYRVEREDKGGIGYVDFIFYPEVDHTADGIILELKVNDTPKKALQQIKDRKYVLRFEGKLGERPKYTGRVLGVGISYDKGTKIHACKIEVLRDRIS